MAIHSSNFDSLEGFVGEYHQIHDVESTSDPLLLIKRYGFSSCVVERDPLKKWMKLKEEKGEGEITQHETANVIHYCCF